MPKTFAMWDNFTPWLGSDDNYWKDSLETTVDILLLLSVDGLRQSADTRVERLKKS